MLTTAMAASTPPISAPVLSQKQRRAALRKERRKRKRQALAQARQCTAEEEEEEEDTNDGDGENDDVAEEEKQQRLHEEWLERERIAQEEFRQQVEREEAARKRKEEEERMIKEEWEAQQRKEQEEKELKQQEKRDREKQPSYSLTEIHSKRKTFSSHNKDEAVQKMLDEAESELDNAGPWMNPEAPVTGNSENFGTERDVANCPFFLKTGACRFGDRCSRKHVYPTASPTLMIRSMFKTFGMEESRRDDYDIDAYLEHSEEDLQEAFLEFYHDVLPEFRSVGKVVQFKVSCNYEPHLRGNVYVQFDTEEQCKDAFIKFNGRWYAGRQLHCEICPVTRWKNAICGLHDRRKCPKGKHCNFLHVFRNPGNEFWEADKDLHLSPDRSVRGSRRDGWHSERHGGRSWRQRHHSRSPVRSERSHSRRDDIRRRSRSRDRRTSRERGEEKASSRSRYSDRRKDLRQSKDRTRSRSRDREPDRMRNSRERERDHKHRNRSEDRDRSRSTSRDRKRKKQSRERSPKNKKITNDDDNTYSRHKHSKKSKKKSKKKHKKKSRKPEGTSSGESDEGKKSEDETEDTHGAQSPSGERDETEITQKNGDMETVCSENNISPEPKSEQFNIEVQSDLSGNVDSATSQSEL